MNAKPVSQPPKDRHPINGIALEPQRIRTFVIEYNPDPEAEAKKAAELQQKSEGALVEQLMNPSSALGEQPVKEHLEVIATDKTTAANTAPAKAADAPKPEAQKEAAPT